MKTWRVEKLFSEPLLDLMDDVFSGKGELSSHQPEHHQPEPAHVEVISDPLSPEPEGSPHPFPPTAQSSQAPGPLQAARVHGQSPGSFAGYAPGSFVAFELLKIRRCAIFCRGACPCAKAWTEG